MILNAADVISGNEGRATVVLNGKVENLFFIKSVEATMEKNKAEVKTVGSRATKHKTTGWSGTGSLTIYYMTSIFRKLAVEYAKTGKDVYFTLTVVNEDAGSTVGKQTTVLYNCNFDNTIIAKLDVESDAMDESLDFTFEDLDLLDEFGAPIN